MGCEGGNGFGEGGGLERRGGVGRGLRDRSGGGLLRRGGGDFAVKPANNYVDRNNQTRLACVISIPVEHVYR